MNRIRTTCTIATFGVVMACATEPAADSTALLRDAATRVLVRQDARGVIDWHETALAGSPRLQRLRAELEGRAVPARMQRVK